MLQKPKVLVQSSEIFWNIKNTSPHSLQQLWIFISYRPQVCLLPSLNLWKNLMKSLLRVGGISLAKLCLRSASTPPNNHSPFTSLCVRNPPSGAQDNFTNMTWSVWWMYRHLVGPVVCSNSLNIWLLLNQTSSRVKKVFPEVLPVYQFIPFIPFYGLNVESDSGVSVL